MKVGFIGLGAMGSAMASNLLAAGHTVTVWNRSETAC
jgi:3-hydroxyisobutyrate dehydrogenase-like beta-hydroxyacid dehydrogenase